MPNKDSIADNCDECGLPTIFRGTRKWDVWMCPARCGRWVKKADSDYKPVWKSGKFEDTNGES